MQEKMIDWDRYISPGPDPRLMRMRLTGGVSEESVTKQESEVQEEKKTAPIIEDGKTLDELMTNPFARDVLQAERAAGWTDEEIWAAWMAW